MPRLPSPPAPLPQAGEGRIRLRFGWFRALDYACSPRRRTSGPCCRDAATSVAPAGPRPRKNFDRGSTGCLACRGWPLPRPLPACCACGEGRTSYRIGLGGSHAAAAPHPQPFPRKLRGGREPARRASAGSAHSTTRAVREGGLWALVAATSVAPAGRAPHSFARSHTSIVSSSQIFTPRLGTLGVSSHSFTVRGSKYGLVRAFRSRSMARA